jgi:murein L,D-transpeptidase YafK
MYYPPLLPLALISLTLALPLPAWAFSFPWSQPPAQTEQGEDTPKPEAAQVKPSRADRILVKKSERRLYLMSGGQPFRSYRISLGYQPTGHKRRQGDGRTPEGLYFLDGRHSRSNYYKAMHISYPNAQDRLRALRDGKDPGGAIMIHGQPGRRAELKRGDWTFGCIAVTNMELDEIWSYTDLGTPIEILP